jgi:predicted ATPase
VGNLFKQAAEERGKQIIISTQSASLLSEFSPEDVIVVERHKGESIFRRLNPKDLTEWLNEYSLGELWQKNLLGGRPKTEDAPQLVTDGAD